jgi:hypothetical protein
VAGLAASLAYPAALFLPLPKAVLLLAVAVFGLGISIAAVGLYFLLALHRKTVSLQIGAGANVAAGMMLLCMLITQLSVNSMVGGLMENPPPDVTVATVQMVWEVVGHVQLGLDIVWDIYLCFGTLLIVVAMRRHPRFGTLFFWSGLLVVTGLTGCNLWTFPTPPGEAGLVDLGPVLGFWYLLVSIQVLRSLGWVDARMSERVP